MYVCEIIGDWYACLLLTNIGRSLAYLALLNRANDVLVLLTTNTISYLMNLVKCFRS